MTSKREVPLIDIGIRYPGIRNDIDIDPDVVVSVIPEMIPEIVVPDLTDFKLKPYVSYKTPEVHQTAFTSRDLFDAVYARKIHADFQAGRLEADGITPKELSLEEKQTQQEAWEASQRTGSDLFSVKKDEVDSDIKDVLTKEEREEIEIKKHFN